MLSGALLISGLALMLLHSLLVAAWLVDYDPQTLYAALGMLALGAALIWASRRLNASIFEERGLNVRYGRTYLGCVWSGVNPLELAAVYLLAYATTVFVAAVEGEMDELKELLGAMHFIITAVICVVYPIFYHPHRSYLTEVADILEGLRRTIGAKAFSYARGVGLIADLGGGEYLILSLPPFQEAAPFYPLLAVDEASLGEGVVALDAQMVAVKLLGRAESYVSLLSLIDWPFRPRLRVEEGWRSLDLGEDGVVCHLARGLLDMPHPEDRKLRLRGRAAVAEVYLGRKKIRRAEHKSSYALHLASRLAPKVLAELRSLAANNSLK